MFRDPLQKRLQEMERESPSPSLVTIKPTLKERFGFLRRYLSKSVEQVLQIALEKKMMLEAGSLESKYDIDVASEGNWFNSRYDYAECNEAGGRTDTEDLVTRYAKMKDYYLTVAQKGKMIVGSHRLEDVECDTILRSSNWAWASCKHMYFNNGEFTEFYREYTPSIWPSPMPRDKMVDYSKIKDIVERARPLIRRMEIEVGRKLIPYDKL